MREGMMSAQTLDDWCLQYKPSRLTILNLKTGRQLQEPSLVAAKYRLRSAPERIGQQGKPAPFPLRYWSAIWPPARKHGRMRMRRT